MACGGAFPGSVKTTGRSPPCPLNPRWRYSSSCIGARQESWGRHDIMIVFPPACGQDQGPHNHQNQNNAQRHHFQQPSFAANTPSSSAVAIQCDPRKEPEIRNDQKPAQPQLDSTSPATDTKPSPCLPPETPPRPEDDPRRWFEDPDRPFELEIGSGKGTFLIQEAPHRPEHNFLGIEWMMAFWRYAADRQAASTRNAEHPDVARWTPWNSSGNGSPARAFTISSPVPVIRDKLTPAPSASRKPVVATLQEFHRVIEPGGTLRIVTDHDELWPWYEEHVARCPLFEREPYERVSGCKTR